MAILARARALAARCGQVEEQRAALLNLVKLHTDRGDADAAIALLDECEALAPHYGNPSMQQGVAAARYYLHYMRGEVDRAGAAAQALMALLRPITDRMLLLKGVNQVLDLYLHGGRLDAARALLDEAAEAARRGTPRPLPLELRLKSVWLRLLEGDVAAAWAELQALEREPADAHPAHSGFEGALLHARVGAQVALALGDSAAAQRHLDTVDPGLEMPTDHEAPLLALRLTLATRTGAAAGAWLDRARELLHSGCVPHFEAVLLRQALERTAAPG
jgi:ATP/maltotriose-dependent transcriptional regulator MalT